MYKSTLDSLNDKLRQLKEADDMKPRPPCPDVPQTMTKVDVLTSSNKLYHLYYK